jgi:uncharacterized protein (DUF2345 family)
MGRSRDKEAAQLLDAAMEFIVNLTEDDTDEPALNLYDEAGPASTSQERVDAFGEAIWAVYDLYRLWKSMGPRQKPSSRASSPAVMTLAPAVAARSSRSATGLDQSHRLRLFELSRQGGSITAGRSLLAASALGIAALRVLSKGVSVVGAQTKRPRDICAGIGV